jgi:hypothetical protein
MNLDQIRESINKNLGEMIAADKLTNDAKEFILMCLSAKD